MSPSNPTVEPAAVARGLVVLLALLAAGPAPAAEPSAERLLARTRVLASDEFEGRAPGTPGEERTVAYLEAEFRRMGLAPGNPDGTYVQAVPAAGITSRTELAFEAGGRRLELQAGLDFIGLSRRRQAEVALEGSEVVFVGYGVTAPEFGWDDFKDADVRGKTVLMLVNDPPVRGPDGAPDDAAFGGRAMTYYGRWTYKYESASARGAAAVFIIHETGPAGYPFAVIAAGSGRETFDAGSPAEVAARVAVEGWISLETARRLCAAAGRDFAELKAAAVDRSFRPVPLAARAQVRVANTVREVVSRNVVARLPGSDPARRDEAVVFTAHWDGYGRDPARSGDQILNGAADNAIAVAMLLEIAELTAALPPAERPRRSLLFLAPTYEEKGLLGSQHYVRQPLHPLERTAANLNLEPLSSAPAYGPTRDLEVVGRNRSTIDAHAAEVAREQGRVLAPDSEPEKGYYYRSDHIEFAKAGVPAFFVRAGVDEIGAPPGTGEKRRLDYLVNDYHKPSDEVRPDWTMAGAAGDTRFLLALGRRIADAEAMPVWAPGSEFKAVGDARLARP
jgi:Zn-dependent M28 family amino/carboxypeptidase